MAEIDPRLIEDFLRDVMMIERKYATDLKNARTQRRRELEAFIETFAHKELDGADHTPHA